MGIEATDPPARWLQDPAHPGVAPQRSDGPAPDLVGLEAGDGDDSVSLHAAGVIGLHRRGGATQRQYAQ